MMGRDDVLVGVGGDGGISYSGTIYPNVGGFLPLIDQVQVELSFYHLSFHTNNIMERRLFQIFYREKIIF
jgi:hypothetical protein